MFEFNLNVYEAFKRIHELAGNGDPGDTSAMDRAEYRVQLNKLVEGLVELLEHAAEHKLISLDIGNFDHPVEAGEIGVYRDGSAGPAANHTVAIRVPQQYLPAGGPVSEAIESFNLGTVETSADLALAAMAHMRFVSNDEPNLDERLYEAWAVVADRLLPRVTASVQRLDAAGLLKLYDPTTKRSYFPTAVLHDAHGSAVEITFDLRATGHAPKVGAPAKRTRRKAVSKKRS